MSENLVDKFYREPHADGVTYYAKRGKKGFRAVDWDEETDRLYPILPEIERAENRVGFKEVDRDQVPDHIEEDLEDRFIGTEELKKALNTFSDKDAKPEEGDSN